MTLANVCHHKMGPTWTVHLISQEKAEIWNFTWNPQFLNVAMWAVGVPGLCSQFVTSSVRHVASLGTPQWEWPREMLEIRKPKQLLNVHWPALWASSPNNMLILTLQWREGLREDQPQQRVERERAHFSLKPGLWGVASCPRPQPDSAWPFQGRRWHHVASSPKGKLNKLLCGSQSI